MNEKVDTGKIIKVSKFKINKNESLLSLSMRSYRNMYLTQNNNKYDKKQKLHSEKTWHRELFEKKERKSGKLNQA